MPAPITPLVGCDVFVLNNENKLLLIQRSDNGLWALPGGCHDLGETPKQCAERECFEESGFKVKCTDLIGVYSSNCYEYIHYPWKDNEFTHLLFLATLEAGIETTSNETINVGWFAKNEIPELSDGHAIRIKHGWEFITSEEKFPYFE
ncbi:NUDIX domain-containing protein [Bacteriovorax sp. DB6_IX]|uniref:NUDIX domain-containing protein n=1 Tax=Bacteriovorax sp. DB6_IX TaxID=1353530 RepID=UPI000389DAF1|nr:NUDIX domain-containing protein [Bacteriovorax sp. DB6_IX]EQC46701.1 NUDIX domain protein [Bacteriovorax sp. DB6_IX]